MNVQSRSASPLSDPDNLDVVGERSDGGVDLLVVTAGPLDASDETCRRLAEKLRAYLHAAMHPNFANVYPAARDGHVRIFVSDAHAISERAQALVRSFAVEALTHNVEIRIGRPVVQQVAVRDRAKRDE